MLLLLHLAPAAMPSIAAEDRCKNSPEGGVKETDGEQGTLINTCRGGTVTLLLPRATKAGQCRYTYETR
jgi:hypothetical protein